MSDEGFEINLTPPEVRELAKKNAEVNLLPDKSRKVYEQRYKVFQDWCTEQKVILLMGYNGALRREELVNMDIDDVDIKADCIIVTIPKTKNNSPRVFVITNTEWIAMIKKYVDLRAKNVKNNRFFLTYRKGRCINCPIGINTMGNVCKDIASFLNLPTPERYTGHCFRRSSATPLANCGGDLLTLKQHGGWKSSAVAEGYVEATRERKIEVANLIKSKRARTDDRNLLEIQGCSRTSPILDKDTTQFSANQAKEIRRETVTGGCGEKLCQCRECVYGASRRLDK
ncbi:hypothetical protein PPYR_13334 [Photinus pyralis]|uniref:Tyr recombinase domain-containing protein n=1 Tax=Photinus pyralis TaxID=7054 RepID=A0A5N4A8S3_PHOPY|nr:hypothetical protein PPYR_13334 [Photinus pyralis]